MKLFLLQTTAAALVSAGAYAEEQPITVLNGSDADSMVALQGACSDGWDAGRKDLRNIWEDEGMNCNRVWYIEDEAERLKKKKYPGNSGSPNKNAYNECARDAIDAEVKKIEKDCLKNPDQCIDLGRSAAELIVKDEWCTPMYAHDQSKQETDYKKECKQAAYSICEGQIPRVADEWCPYETLRGGDLRRMQGECEDKVDDMIDQSKPTKKPTPNNKPTRKPTKMPTSNNKCVDNTKPKAKRNGSTYKFILEKSNAECADSKNRIYSWGEFRNVKNFSKCADKCVKDVRSSLLSDFQGYNWDCKKNTCRCLYNKGALENKNSDGFDETDRYRDGRGSVKNARNKQNTYCGKLKKVKFVGMNDESDHGEEGDVEMEARRALRAGN